MLNARYDRGIGSIGRGCFRVVISFITLAAFLFNTVFYEIALLRPLGFVGQAWADTLRRGQQLNNDLAQGDTEPSRSNRVPSEFTSVGSDRAVSPGIFKELNVKTFSLPPSLGTIKDSWSPQSFTFRRGQQLSNGLAQDESLPAVAIHIQDAHCNYYAQRAISGIIEYLNREYGISEINLEGGAKDYDISVFTDIKDRVKRDEAADYFVKEGLVNGAEYFAINNPEKVNLWGIEDVRLYIDNLKIYRNSLKYKDEADKHLKNLSYILYNLKLKIYSKELLELDSKYNAYKADQIGFKDYLGYLLQKSKERLIDIKAYTSIYLLSQALGQEAGIDFRKANNERDELIDKLEKKLSRNSLKELVSKTAEFKSELISQADFYRYLSDKAGSINMKLDDFPELKKYSVYVAAYQAIDKSKIMVEVEGLEDKLKASLFTADKDRELDILSKNLALMQNIFNVSITRDDYRYYKANERSFEIRNFAKFIEREAPVYKIRAELDGDIAKLDGYREDICKFYEYSFKRDAAFVKNIRLADSAAILITGGFHTENLTEEFKKQGIAYISIIPNFKNSDGYQCPYFNILSGADKTQLVKAIPALLAANMATASQLSPALYNAVVKELRGTSVDTPPALAHALTPSEVSGSEPSESVSRAAPKGPSPAIPKAAEAASLASAENPAYMAFSMLIGSGIPDIHEYDIGEVKELAAAHGTSESNIIKAMEAFDRLGVEGTLNETLKIITNALADKRAGAAEFYFEYILLPFMGFEAKDLSDIDPGIREKVFIQFDKVFNARGELRNFVDDLRRHIGDKKQNSELANRLNAVLKRYGFNIDAIPDYRIGYKITRAIPVNSGGVGDILFLSRIGPSTLTNETGKAYVNNADIMIYEDAIENEVNKIDRLVACVFRTTLTTHSARLCPLIPVDPVHLFRSTLSTS